MQERFHKLFKIISRWWGRSSLIGGAAVLGLGIWFYEDVFEERWVVPRFGEIEPGLLYRSGQLPSPIVGHRLRDWGVREIVNLTAVEFDDPKQVAQASAVRALGIVERRFSMGGDGVIHGDDALTVQRYVGAVSALHRAREAGHVALVHCQAGTQRTGGVVAAYRLLVEGRGSAEVYAEALEYDWDPTEDHAWPSFLNRNMADIAEGLVASGVLAAAPDPLPVFAPW